MGAWIGVHTHTHTHTHTHQGTHIDKPAHTSVYTFSEFSHMNLYTDTQEPNTYAHTHVHTQRSSVQDHSRVIIEQENVYVMADQMLCTSLMLTF